MVSKLTVLGLILILTMELRMHFTLKSQMIVLLGMNYLILDLKMLTLSILRHLPCEPAVMRRFR